MNTLPRKKERGARRRRGPAGLADEDLAVRRRLQGEVPLRLREGDLGEAEELLELGTKIKKGSEKEDHDKEDGSSSWEVR